MQSTTKPRILIVDDEPETIRALTLSLRSRGFPVEAAGNAGDALRLLGGRSRFGVVLTDYSMPGMNGVQFLGDIRAGWAGLPVILMTAFGKKEVLVEALRNRCDGFIEKPFTIEELTAEIERVTRLEKPHPAEASNEISELVPMLVHQLNNPLNIIMGIAQLGILESAAAGPITARLGMILEASNKIQRLNREILDLGKGLSGSFEMVDARQVLCDCLDSFSVSSELYGIGIERCLDGGESLIHGNRFALEQMFCNLIANGLEAMADRRAGTLTVRLSLDSALNKVVIDFLDQGCGMSSDVAERIFTPYYTTKEGGTGLGLAVVQRVVRAHKGEITVAGTVAKGTRFTVSLPLITSSPCREMSES